MPKKLFRILFDGEYKWVEAEGYCEAVALWQGWLGEQCDGVPFEDLESPESVELVDDRGPVLRRAQSLDAVAKSCHEHWLLSADRSYSPMNKPWHELTRQQRADSASQCRQVLDAVGVMYVDEYDQPEAPPFPGTETAPIEATSP